jgi:hypothetical protein
MLAGAHSACHPAATTVVGVRSAYGPAGTTVVGIINCVGLTAISGDTVAVLIPG